LVPAGLPRLQELQALIQYIGINKAADLDWFTIRPSNKEGTHWAGKCWYVHDLIRYEFDFQVSVQNINACCCCCSVLLYCGCCTCGFPV
jgi:hypothetical protein